VPDLPNHPIHTTRCEAVTNRTQPAEPHRSFPVATGRIPWNLALPAVAHRTLRNDTSPGVSVPCPTCRTRPPSVTTPNLASPAEPFVTILTCPNHASRHLTRRTNTDRDRSIHDTPNARSPAEPIRAYRLVPDDSYAAVACRESIASTTSSNSTNAARRRRIANRSRRSR
jgi:hypothetical protein